MKTPIAHNPIKCHIIITIKEFKQKEVEIEMLKIRYADEIVSTMKRFFESLSEKDRRRYAAVEALKLGNGGQKYISEILGCDPDTVRKATEELQNVMNKDDPIRIAGGGKKNDRHSG